MVSFNVSLWWLGTSIYNVFNNRSIQEKNETILIIFLLPSLLFAGINSKPKIDYEAWDKIPLNEIVVDVGNELAKSLPRQLDVVTQLWGVFFYENTMTYQRKINTKHSIMKSIWEFDKR